MSLISVLLLGANVLFAEKDSPGNNSRIYQQTQQDSLDTQKDSLSEIVPYLDEVEPGAVQNMVFIYMLVILLTTFMSEDLACIGAGLMVAQGIINFWPAASACVIGIFIGDYSIYIGGRLLGTSIFKVRPFSWIVTEDNLEITLRWFKSRGPVILVGSRFIPGSRVPVYLSAGLLDTGFWRFSLYFGLTVLLWTPVFVWLSVFAGNEILAYYEKYDDYAIWILLGALAILFVAYKYLLPLFTARGRRIFWKNLKRLFRR